MTKRKDPPAVLDDVEKSHPLVCESGGDGASPPVTVRLSDPWSDFLPVAEKRNARGNPTRSSSVLPFLDDMKGILQWD